ncbi:MAG TPA: hypothetical protein VGK19_04160 [Capsulimonadaceae bacterium]
MDNNSPQYWRNIGNLSAIPCLLGLVLIVIGAVDLRNHPYVSIPQSYCADQNGTPCSPEVRRAIEESEGHNELLKSQSDVEGYGAGFIFWGFLIALGGLIPGTVAGSNLTRIEREVLDYQYEQMQAERFQRGAVRAQIVPEVPISEAEPDYACPSCNETNAINAKFCSGCGRRL